jgi:hypothetical protein
MSEMAPESGGGGGNLFTGRIMGIPGVVWLLGAGVLAYFIFFRKGSAGAGGSTSGGGGTIDTSGTQTTLQKGAIAVTVSQTDNNPATAKNPQPTPKPPPRKRTLDYRDLAIQALEDKGIKNPTPQQIADEQNDIRATVGLGKAVGKPPPGGGTDKGVL